jgi:hypothetical protein
MTFVEDIIYEVKEILILISQNVDVVQHSQLRGASFSPTYIIIIGLVSDSAPFRDISLVCHYLY